ncbi:MAG: MGMT family protein [Planctomycetes bacterium]|nr:MGMT family protein [Planctomycetota bacterium]
MPRRGDHEDQSALHDRRRPRGVRGEVKRARTASRDPRGSTDARTARDELVQRILATVDSIPKGSVASYGQVAREAGLPRHARLVGRVLRELPTGSKLAWHRVVNAAGRISPRADGTPSPEQHRRLEREGVHFEPNGRIDLARFGWRPK